MKRHFFRFYPILLITFLCSGFLSSQDHKTKSEKYWIFFVDKGPNSSFGLAKAQSNPLVLLAERALKRRSKVLTDQNRIDWTDLPVYEPYLETLRKMGLLPVTLSRWLNAASFVLTPSEYDMVQPLSFIEKMQPVRKFRRIPIANTMAKPETGILVKPMNDRFDYGTSIVQNNLVNVPAVHNFGVSGDDVWIGLLDDGFDIRNHPVFTAMEVVATFDFINNDEITYFQEGQDCGGQGNHGTKVLSVIGGFEVGELIGPAFKSNFLLAKTEKVCDPATGGGFEEPIEEDYWVAGIEWLERMGADIASSSLGYNDWYNYEDMDGNTAVTTIAADLAVNKGMVVITSAGNEGNSLWRYITAPADGDSVIAVGAVYRDSSIVGFSSRGPTFDGRIKPDVMAMGSGVYMATSSMSGYQFGGGTSFSCPQVAGVAALILSAHPELTPTQVHAALRETADRADNPDNDYGWGIVNAWRAIQYHGLTFSAAPELVILENGDYYISINIISNYGVNPESVKQLWRSGSTGAFNEVYFELIENYTFSGIIPRQPAGTVIELYFEATDSSGQFRSHPLDAPDQVFQFTAGDTLIDPNDKKRIPDSFVLYHNFPNPFDPGLGATQIRFDIKEPILGSIKIYNQLGQLVRTLVPERMLVPGRYKRFTWDGLDDQGLPVANGIYFYQLRTAEFTQTQKMTLLRSR